MVARELGPPENLIFDPDVQVQYAAQPIGALLPPVLDCIHVCIFVGGVIGDVERDHVEPGSGQVFERAVGELRNLKAAGVVES